MLQLANVENEYKKFGQLERAEVLKLLEWVQKQPHLPDITELEALLFLHACCYSMETTKTVLDTYYSCHTHCPEFFAQRDVMGKDIVNAMDISLFCPLPGLTPNGCKVMVCKLTNPDPSRMTFNDELKLFSMAVELWLMEEGTAEGHILVCDMENVVFGHLAKLSIISIKKYLFYLQEAIPFRLKGLHFINIVPFMDKILALMKPFMKKELWDVLELHTGVDTIFKTVPQEMLAAERGGQAGSYEDIKDKYFKHVKECREYFLEEEKSRRVDECCRPGKPKGAGDLFGIEGNFKKLDVD